MRRWLNILPVVAALAVLAVGGGGLSLMRCSCSGKVSLASGSDCCPSEGSCMVFSTLRLSDSAPASTCVPPAPVESVNVFVQPFTVAAASPVADVPCCNPFENFAPPGVETAMVMRV